MFPSSAIDDLADISTSEFQFICNIHLPLASRTSRSDLSYQICVKFCSPVFFTMRWLKTEYVQRMPIVSASGRVFEVLKIWICLVAIFVIDIVSLWARSNKGKHHESMNEKILLPSIEVEQNGFIASMEACEKNSPLASFATHRIDPRDPHVAQVRYFVTSLITGNWQPNFIFHRAAF